MRNQPVASLWHVADLSNPIHKLSDEECLTPKRDGKGVKGVSPDADGTECLWDWLDNLYEVPYLSQ